MSAVDSYIEREMRRVIKRMPVRQYERYREIFEIVDCDGDGTLSIADVRADLRQRFNDPPEGAIKSIWAAIGDDHLRREVVGCAGGLRFDEFLLAMERCGSTAANLEKMVSPVGFDAGEFEWWDCWIWMEDHLPWFVQRKAAAGHTQVSQAPFLWNVREPRIGSCAAQQ